MEDIKIVGPDQVSRASYKKLRLKALFEEPQAFGSSFIEEKETSDIQWQRRLDNYRKGDRNWMFFAIVDNQPVGMLGAFQTIEDEKAQTAMIIGMFVSEEYRGKGIAKMLMQRVLEELQSKHIMLVRINVNVDQTIAFEMYKKFGFIVKKKVNYKMGDGKYHDEYCMEKSLI